MEIHRYVCDAGCPLRQGRNNFACFNEMENRKGVYVFQSESDGSVLYVGQAGARGEDHNLKERVQQHYRKGKTGANMSINWRKENCSRCKGESSCDAGGACTFNLYRGLLRSCRVVFFYFNDEDATEKNIDALEKQLKFAFQPKYDDEIMKTRGGSFDEAEADEVIGFLLENGREPGEAPPIPEANRIDIGGDDAANNADRIDIDAAICGGRPRIRGTRIRVSDILNLMAAGVSSAGILADYPSLSRDDLKAALAFGAQASDRAGRGSA